MNSGLRGTRLIRLTSSLLLHNVIGHEVMAKYICMRHLYKWSVVCVSFHYNMRGLTWVRHNGAVVSENHLLCQEEAVSLTMQCPTMLTYHCYTHTQKKLGK